MKKLYLLVWESLKKTGFGFLFCVLGLQVLGLSSLYSAAQSVGHVGFGLFHKQMLWIALGWVVFFVIQKGGIRFIVKIIKPLLVFNLIGLILLFVMGREIYGTKRWLDLSFFHWQPSETLKFTLTLWTAWFLSQRPFVKALGFVDLASLSLVVLPLVGLVFYQPDLGTAGVLCLMSATLVLFQGVQRKALITACLIIVAVVPVGWHFLKPYQKSRIRAFIHPEEDPQGAGYSVIQSKIAIGSGQITGKGWGAGSQNKLKFLPERHTDFIFSVLSEEYGFLGSSLILLLFFFLILLHFQLAGQTQDRLSCWFCLAGGVFFLWHVGLNLAMTMGVFPVVGIPLPLLSYGGSHTLTAMAFLGLKSGIYKSKDWF